MRLSLLTLLFASTSTLTFAQTGTQNPGQFAELTYEKNYHEFGSVMVGTPCKCTFYFTNTGNAPLVIHSVATSCGCDLPRFYPKHPVMPGQRDSIGYMYNSYSRVGAFNKTMTVRSNAQNVVYARVCGFVYDSFTPPKEPDYCKCGPRKIKPETTASSDSSIQISSQIEVVAKQNINFRSPDSILTNNHNFPQDISTISQSKVYFRTGKNQQNTLSSNQVMKVFPNPVQKGSLLNTSLELIDANISLLDATGKEVLSWTGINGFQLPQIPDFIQTGVYHLQILNHDEMERFKLVIVD